MAMKIRVTRLRGEGTASRELTLQTRTATVGRGPDRDVILDDPERVVSGQHALIECRGNEIWITDLSRNGTFVNQPNEPLPPHQAVALAPSDRILIGPFELRISLVDDAAPSPLPAMPPKAWRRGCQGSLGPFNPRISWICWVGVNNPSKALGRAPYHDYVISPSRTRQPWIPAWSAPPGPPSLNPPPR